MSVECVCVCVMVSVLFQKRDYMMQGTIYVTRVSHKRNFSCKSLSQHFFYEEQIKATKYVHAHLSLCVCGDQRSLSSLLFNHSPVLVFDTQSLIEPGNREFNQTDWCLCSILFHFQFEYNNSQDLFFSTTFKNVFDFNTEVSYYLYCF